MFSTRTITLGVLTAAALTLGATAVSGETRLPWIGSDAPTLASAASAASAASTPDGQGPPAAQVAFWQRRVDANPTSALDRTQLGLAITAQARAEADLTLYEQAESALRQAEALNPQYPPTLLALGHAVHAQHEFAESRRIATEVLSAQPTSLPALALLGDAQLELGEYEQAAATYRRLAERDSSPAATSRLSRLAYLTGRPDDALQLAERSLDDARRRSLAAADESFYWFQLGYLRFATGDADAAIDALEHARLLDPDGPGATEQLAFVYASTGRDGDAIELYRQLLDSGPAADLHGQYAQLLRRSGDAAGADRHLQLGIELALETADRFPAERRHLIGFLVGVDPDLAVTLAEADLAERQDVGAYDALAWALHHAGRHAEAACAAQRVIGSGIRDAAMLYHAGAVLIAAGDEASGRSLVAEALDINEHFDPVDADLARALVSGRDR
jgi:tetratricopeptide (TPR) repeat protein